MKKPGKLKIIASETAEMAVNELFGHYIDVCNRALEAHEDKFPYKELIAAGEKLSGGDIHLAVYEDVPEAVYTLQFQDKRLTHRPDITPNMKRAWRVNKSYLRKVVEQPEKYIEQPELLDIDWLKNRLGI